MKDHPRVCGENCGLVGSLEETTGSPPRVRGKLAWMQSGQVFRRITPACAGKTVPFVKQRKCKEDHPRVCGENLVSEPILNLTQGSPPRVRGKHFGNGVFPWLILVLSLDLL